MEKKQVLVRLSDDTFQRLQDLSNKYGLPVSGLFAAWINERWLVEFSSLPSCGKVEPPTLVEQAQTPKPAVPVAKPAAPAQSSRKRKRR